MAARKKMYKPTGKRRKKSKSAGMKKGSCKRVKTKGRLVCLCRTKAGKVRFSKKCGTKKRKRR